MLYSDQNSFCERPDQDYSLFTWPPIDLAGQKRILDIHKIFGNEVYETVKDVYSCRFTLIALWMSGFQLRIYSSLENICRLDKSIYWLVLFDFRSNFRSIFVRPLTLDSYKWILLLVWITKSGDVKIWDNLHIFINSYASLENQIYFLVLCEFMIISYVIVSCRQHGSPCLPLILPSIVRRSREVF